MIHRFAFSFCFYCLLHAELSYKRFYVISTHGILFIKVVVHAHYNLFSRHFICNSYLLQHFGQTNGLIFKLFEFILLNFVKLQRKLIYNFKGIKEFFLISGNKKYLTMLSRRQIAKSLKNFMS